MTDCRWLIAGLLCAVLSACVTSDPPLPARTHSDAKSAPATLAARTPDAASTDMRVASIPTSPVIRATPTADASVKASVKAAVDERVDTEPSATAVATPASRARLPQPMIIEEARQTGQVENAALDEISGLSASRTMPGVLFALNDSGNKAELYAMSETGGDLGHWQVNARNRDWEDMASVELDGKHYLLLGDTGDNRQSRRESALYLVEEPALDTPASAVLEPQRTLRFRYVDGPRNVEALAVNDGIVYLVSKEPVGPDGPRASRLYTLSIPDKATDELLIAGFAGELPLAPAGLEARLAAAVAGVDLNHPTALDFDTASNTAYLLTYRHVVRVQRRENQSWSEALTSSAQRIHSHDLRQAEAMAVSTGQAIWLTSEHTAAPLWALPIQPPS